MSIPDSFESGRIAMVLQRSVLSGVSWEIVRDQFLEKCEIEYIISNYDPGDPIRGVEGWNWSENTDLGGGADHRQKNRNAAGQKVNRLHQPLAEAAQRG
jgi:hypothetical protein